MGGNFIKLSKNAIKMVFENDRSIRNFGKLKANQAFICTKDETQKLSKNKAYNSYVNFNF